jgi:hypothetical protein
MISYRLSSCHGIRISRHTHRLVHSFARANSIPKTTSILARTAVNLPQLPRLLKSRNMSTLDNTPQDSSSLRGSYAYTDLKGIHCADSLASLRYASLRLTVVQMDQAAWRPRCPSSCRSSVLSVLSSSPESLSSRRYDLYQISTLVLGSSCS